MKSVLVVENDPELRKFINRVIASRYTVLEATTSVEALDICRNHPEVDLMVCDMEHWTLIRCGIDIAPSRLDAYTADSNHL